VWLYYCEREKVLDRLWAGLVSGVWVLVLFVAVFGVVLNVPVVWGSGTIYIRADGSIDPPTAPIQRDENVYTFTDNIYDGIVVERNNMIIDGNGYTLQSSLSSYGFYLNGINNVTIRNTNISGAYLGVWLYHSSRITISNNAIVNNYGGVYLDFYSNNNLISGNTITNNTSQIIDLVKSSYNTISENIITNNTRVLGAGVSIHESSNFNTISGNTITNNGYAPGISIWFLSNNNTVSGNTITNITHFGVSVDGGENNTISGNTLTHNSGGVNIYAVSNNIVSGNIATNNERGIEISSLYGESSNNTISGNTVTNNTYGIFLEDAPSNNKFYHNNIMNNTYQVGYFFLGRSSVNTWDDGYPSGGNYWSDYAGVDEKSGPNQDQPGSDGIGDTPYVIDSNDQDRYPLMSPLDMSPPTTTHDYNGLWHTENFTITLTATDDVSGVAETYYRINNGLLQNISAHGQPLITEENADNKLEYWSVDNSGKEESPHNILTGIKLDKTPPSGSIIINNDDANTTTQSVTLNLWASDATSGVSQMRFSNDGTNWTSWEAYATSKAWNLSLGEDTKTVYAQYKDVAGLVSSAYNDTITLLDVHSPTTIISLSGVEGENEWFTSNVNVTLIATDDISGVEKTEYSFDNATWNTYTTPFTITNQGTTTIYYKSTDKAGNVETTKTQTIKIDKTVPTGSIIINNGDAYTTSTSVTLTLTASDATSGVYQMRFSNDGTTWTDWEAYTTSKSWTLPSEDGTKTVHYQIKDNAGLISETYTDTIVLDTTIPNIETPTREPADNIQPDQTVKVSVNVTDAISQVKNVTLYYTINDGETWTDLPMNHTASNLYEATIPPQQADTTVRFKITAYDHAGNNATLDGTQPYCTYQVIPEFPPSLILPLFIITTLLAAICFRRKQKTTLKII
jgi:parallel beta-helix repeat protein